MNLLHHIDGSTSAPSEYTIADGKSHPNPAFVTWKKRINGLFYFFNPLSLKKQCPKSSDIPLLIRKFKSITDQLATIGHFVSDEDKRYSFLCGLDSSFEMFSTAQRMVCLAPPFRDLLDQAENHELFLQTLNTQSPPPAAFSAQSNRFSQHPKSSCGSSSGRFRGSSYRRGRSTTNRRPPYCQLCRKDGHYASSCPNLASYAQRVTPLDANLAQAFHAQCNVNPDWTADSGATAHMLRSTDGLDESHTNTGNNYVTFGNGQSLPDRKTAEVLAKGTCENGFYVLSHGHKSLVAALAAPHHRASFDK
ncbi:uncharacterized protein LOC143621895 [Bidens hawaiensis]|uniref:uncharacterized protein LOC143621895 n=1 Tax=Bidens hawaiensis TaxID=980011 RepID=UPI0040490DF0